MYADLLGFSHWERQPLVCNVIAAQSQNNRPLYYYYNLSVTLLCLLESLHSIKKYFATSVAYSELWVSICQRRFQYSPRLLLMRLYYWIGTQYKAWTVKNLFLITGRAIGAQCLSCWEPLYWSHLPLQIPNSCTSILYQEEEWFPTIGSRL